MTDPVTDEMRAFIRAEVRRVLDQESLTMADTTRYAHVAFCIGGTKEVWRGVIYPDDRKDLDDDFEQAWEQLP